MHLIEGLEGGRFAMYMKVHHSLVDGYTGMKILSRSFSPDPDDAHTRLFFNVAAPQRPRPQPTSQTNPLFAAIGAVGSAVSGCISSTFNVGRALLNTQIRRDGDYALIANSVQAPHSILNAHISRNRRFATQQYATERLKAIGAEHGATLNDVALAVIGGGLRRFLDELGELPDRSLVSFVPVNVRPKGDVGGGNAVGAILVGMGTDIANPVERLQGITASTRMSKAQLQTMSPNEILAYTAALLAPAATQVTGAVTGIKPPWPYTFNLCVSNVPGPREPLYLRGFSAGSHLSCVDPDAWDGAQYHVAELRRHPQLRFHRVPRQTAALAAARRLHRRGPRRPRGGHEIGATLVELTLP